MTMENLGKQFLDFTISWVEADKKAMTQLPPIFNEYKEKRIAYDDEAVKFVRILMDKGLCSELVSSAGLLWTRHLAVLWYETKFKAELFVFIGSFFVGLGEAVLVVAFILLIIEIVENKGHVSPLSVIGVFCPMLRRCKCIAPYLDKIEKILGTLPPPKMQVQFGSILTPGIKGTAAATAKATPKASASTKFDWELFVEELKNALKPVFDNLSKNERLARLCDTIRKKIEQLANSIKTSNVANKATKTHPVKTDSKVVGGKFDSNNLWYNNGGESMPQGLLNGNYPSPYSPGILREGSQIVGRETILPTTRIGHPLPKPNPWN